MAGLCLVATSLPGTKIVVAFIVLSLTMAHLVYRLNRLRRTPAFPALVLCAVVMFSMLVALALAQVYSNSWRQIAREYGVYEARRPAQRMATAAVVGVVPLLGVLGGLWASGWRFPAATAMAVTFLLLAFAIVKVISYHPVDAILQVEAIHGVTLFGMVFAVGIFALNICLFQCIEDDLGA